MMIFVVKNKGQTQKASDLKVADWQYVGVENVRDDWCRIETVQVEIGPILRIDFRDAAPLVVKMLLIFIYPYIHRMRSCMHPIRLAPKHARTHACTHAHTHTSCFHIVQTSCIFTVIHIMQTHSYTVPFRVKNLEQLE